MKFAYFPGCVIPTSSKEYEMSAKEVCAALGIELAELDDWNCCGATAVGNIDYLLPNALSARNLALAEKVSLDIATLCPVCYYNLWKVTEEDKSYIEKANKALESTGLSYEGKAKVRHVADILINDVGVEKIAQKVTKPLKGLKVIPYYGCYLLRPPRKNRIDSPENPTLLDNIITALGAEVVAWDMKTKCCGGAIVLTNEEISIKLTYDLLAKAKLLGADCITTPCPQCNFMLDAKQEEIEKIYNMKMDIPVLYFTQLIGLAFGIESKKLGMDKNLVSTEKIVEGW